MNRSKGLILLYVVPFLLGVAWLAGPLVSGSETLFVRDVFNTHLPMKAFQAQTMRDGEISLVDPYRSGGQPHLGNPNTVPLYPDNLLFLLAPAIWSVNAHFWIHLLIAPLAFAFLARQWGLGRQAAWASGVVYATSGYYLSTMNLYNLTAGTTLAPAFVGACLALAAEKAGRSAWLGVSLLWALLVLGGDPMTAVVALGAAAGAVGIARGWRRAGWWRLTWALVLGSLIAAPQIIEFLRIVPASYRGVQGYSVSAATAASWSPANLFEWLVPMAFGEPSLLYWGERFHAGRMPLFYSLYPGLVALAAAGCGVAVGGARRRWTLWMVGIGLFFCMGGYNPIAAWLLGLPGMQVLRLPVKLWLVVAMGLALMAGVGLDRLIAGRSRAGFRRALTGLVVLMAVAATVLWLAPSPVAARVGSWMPERIPQSFAAEEVARWAVACTVSVALLVAALTAASLRRITAPVLAGVLLAIHVGGQLVLLGPLVPTDAVDAYSSPSPLLDLIPADGRVVHGDAGGLFGPETVVVEALPGTGLEWLQRDTFQRLYPPAGVLAGRRYEFWSSPEGLDSFLTRAVTQALPLADDPRRLALLEAAGVTHLLLGRPLEGIGEEQAELLAERRVGSGLVHLYRLRQSAAEVQLVGRVLRASDPRQAVAQLVDPTFDPRSAVVLSGAGEPSFGSGGEVRVLESTDESLVVAVETQGPGAVVVQRSYLPIYSASIDGEPAEIMVANMHRMAIEVPAGRHELRLWVDRRTMTPSWLLAGLGIVLLLLRWRRAGTPAVAAG